ncbi:hypothetical protein ACR80S_13325 [Halomonas sp. MA07-2]|uniref:hypothetical protein n=1 Tax=Halomonas sp. MA07-2 TaxID=3440841 RepID=UPI003EECB68A
MGILEIQEKFEIEDSDLSFDQLVREAPDEVAATINEKSVIILPSHGTESAFYTGTLDTLDFLNEEGLDADIYVNDEEYKELGLHGADIWLGTYFVKNFVVPVFCSVIGAYLYEKLKAKKDDKVSVKFVVEKKNGESCAVSYDGKVDDIGKAIDAVKRISDES